MIDAVYVLGKGSTWQDNELRFSLRSLEQYVSGIRNVWIVGELPAWVQNVVHVPFSDSHVCKERNIMDKVLRVCREEALTEEFLFLNDDHFALKPQPARVPNWHGRELLLYEGENKPYRISIGNTARVLRQRGYSRHNFDIHYPIVYNKKEFARVMRMYDWQAECYVVKSIYSNTLSLPGTYVHDIKINGPVSNEYMVRALIDRMWFSLGPKALVPNIKALLAALYPNPSHYEINR